MSAWIIDWAVVIGSVAAVAAVIAAVVVPVALHFHNRSFRGSQKGWSLVTSTCPHAFMNLQENPFGIKIQSTFVSPFGRLDFECQRCRLTINGEHIVDVLTYKPPPGASLLDVVKDFRKRERAFGKAVKRYEG